MQPKVCISHEEPSKNTSNFPQKHKEIHNFEVINKARQGNESSNDERQDAEL